MKIVKANEAAIKEAADILKRGGVVLSPTDTVYGLLADIASRKSVSKLFKIKERDLKKPVPVFVKNIKAAKELAEIDEAQEGFLKKCWPGKITIVLRRKKGKQFFGVDKETIGLRIPKYRILNKILGKVDFPLSGTSANISGLPSSNKISEILKQFEGKKWQPDFVLDAGNLKENNPSKIVDLTKGEMRILRK